MLSLMVNKIAKVSLVVTIMMGVSIGVHAETLTLASLTKNIEQNISAQMQEMMQVTQREISLSLQTQLLETMFELKDSKKIGQLAKKQSETVITSEMVKE
ncbi:MAG: hypothetical protein V5788_01210 [Shewanella sp.]